MVIVMNWDMTHDQQRLWADAVLVWSLVSYLRPDNTLQLESGWPRSGVHDDAPTDAFCAILGALFAGVLGIGSGISLPLAAAVGGLSVSLPLIRRTLLRWHVIEPLPVMELAFPVVIVFVLGWLIEQQARPSFPELIPMPGAMPDRIAISFGLAGVLFVTRGGTHFVKSVCATGQILPRLSTGDAIPVATSQATSASPEGARALQPVDQARIGMGRKLGCLERILMLLFVVGGQYEALGLILAAKGLIRSKEFEDRDFTEYFLLGSLASVLVAVVTGELLRRVISP
jgi:hypothetical protein